MKRTVISGITFTLMLIGVALTFNVHPVMASGTIYIRADGSIDPPTTPISSIDSITYTLTDNIYDSIVIERGNIVIDGDGHTLQGSGSGNGLKWNSINNVTVKRTNIKDFDISIWLISSSGNSISGNNVTNWIYGDGIRLETRSGNNSISGNSITNNGVGIHLVHLCNNNSIYGNDLTANNYGLVLHYSSNNSISENSINANNYDGIEMWSNSNNNSICGNNIKANSRLGMWVISCLNNSITENDIENNGDGIRLESDSRSNSIVGNNIENNEIGIRQVQICSGNRIYHNNFIGNTYQTWSFYLTNVWDDGYPSGGNYWSDYVVRYPYAHELDDSRIWDTPYVINENNRDNYPLMEPWTLIIPTIMAGLDIDPHTWNLGSEGKWITAYIQLPEGYNPEDIDVSTILLNGTIQPVLNPRYDFVTNSSEYLVDNNNDGVLERMVKFDRTAVESLIYNQGIRYGDVSLTLTGELLDGTPFEGTNVVFVNYAGDVNNDGEIDILDAGVISAHWYPGPPIGPLDYDPNSDLNHDGTVNILDSGIVSSNWGQTVPSTTL